MNQTSINVSNLLDGKIVLVTGAGQGNGRAIAQGVAKSGARVVVTDVQAEMAESTAQQIRSQGGEASAFHLDVTDAKECVAVAERVGREIGKVNVLVNNAGIIIRENIDSPRAHENWRRVLDVNVNGIFNVVHALLPALRQTRGSIINVASIAAFVGVADTLGYSPSKGAVKLFTQALARELAADGIRSQRARPGDHRNADDQSYARRSRAHRWISETDAAWASGPARRTRRAGGVPVFVDGVVRQRRNLAGGRRISGGLIREKLCGPDAEAAEI